MLGEDFPDVGQGFGHEAPGSEGSGDPPRLGWDPTAVQMATTSTSLVI